MSLLENAILFAQKKPDLIYPVVADMNSEYPPMKNYLSKIERNIKVIRFENLGPRNLWKNSKFIEITKDTDFYLSDGDIDYSLTDADVFEEMMRVSKKYPGFRKVGSAIRIDDLNDNSLKSSSIKFNEKSNWVAQREIEINIFIAPVDTVFAYYPKYSSNLYFWPALRLAGAYQVRHAPWYETDKNRTEEETFYAETAKWWGVKGKTSGEIIDPKSVEKSSEIKIIKYSFAIKLLLKIAPKLGSILISKFISAINPNSFLR